MPLEFIPDRFGDAKHAELDKAVNKAARIFSKFSSEELSEDLHYILSHIVNKSDGELDSKYAVPEEAETLIKAHDELRDLLLSAWNVEYRSYSKIRNLKILASPQVLKKLSAPATRDVHQVLSNAFRGEYRGAAVDGFYEYLTENEELFRDSEIRYYAKFCSIVQSSGTGKSRMLSELPNKDVITIYINLRSTDDILSFPPRDPVPSDILMKNSDAGEHVYNTNCYAFFIALFQTVEERLATARSTGDAKAAIMGWAKQICDMSEPPKTTAREDFFEKLATKFKQIHHSLDRIIKEQSGESTDTFTIPQPDQGVDTTAEMFARLSVSARFIPQHELKESLQDSFMKMVAALEMIFPDHSAKPKMVIALDEAHPLTVRKSDHRPADTFCRVVKEWSHLAERKHAVWVVFASTTSKVADFSPPNKIHNSGRIAIEGEKLFPPYTRLGWDQSAPPFISNGNVENVSEFEHIAAFGRPLWLSLKSAVWYPSKVLATAQEKLIGEVNYDTSDSHQVVAVLGQRFAVNITFGHPDSVEHSETGVASHLRICLATTLDRTWRFTSYPSEPLLSCAAAKILHNTAKSLEGSLTKLLNLINSGMIDMGQRGELASRLLWLLAKDLFIRTRQGGIAGLPSSWDGHLADCEMIPVVDWFAFIFGSRIWDENKQGSIARKVFENAYVNFSHWVCMDTNVGSTHGDELPLDVWTLRHWQRTSAVQCCHQQPLIDKVIPIHFKGGDKSAKDTMSQILISDKAKISKKSKDVLHSISRRSPYIGGGQSGFDLESPPYIAILADLSQTPKFTATFPEKETTNRCLRIYAGGCDAFVYPFLKDHSELMKMLQVLVLKQKIPETTRQCLEYLDTQVKFGSTATAAHMEWERGGRTFR